jgi:histidine triad (HIT) family protein
LSEGDTIFHKIIRKELPAQIVFEDEQVIAFRDINPAAPVHVLIIPKKTIPSLRDAEEADAELLGRCLLAAKKIASDEGIDESGYRVVINVGHDGSQTVFQLHLHILGGRRLTWPPG